MKLSVIGNRVELDGVPLPGGRLANLQSDYTATRPFMAVVVFEPDEVQITTESDIDQRHAAVLVVGGTNIVRGYGHTVKDAIANLLNSLT